jgi:hypothetical protein
MDATCAGPFRLLSDREIKAHQGMIKKMDHKERKGQI